MICLSYTLVFVSITTEDKNGKKKAKRESFLHT